MQMMAEQEDTWGWTVLNAVREADRADLLQYMVDNGPAIDESTSELTTMITFAEDDKHPLRRWMVFESVPKGAALYPLRSSAHWNKCSGAFDGLIRADLTVRLPLQWTRRSSTSPSATS